MPLSVVSVVYVEPCLHCVCFLTAPEGKVIRLWMRATLQSRPPCPACAHSPPPLFFSLFPVCVQHERQEARVRMLWLRAQRERVAGCCSGAEWFQPLSQTLFVVSGFLWLCWRTREKGGGDTKVWSAYCRYTVSAESKEREHEFQLLQCNNCSFVLSKRKLLNESAETRQACPVLHRLSFFYRKLLFAAVKCSKNRAPLPAGCCID